MGSSFEILQILFSVVVLAFGAICATIYLRKPPAKDGPSKHRNRDERPWRRIGAAICLLVSVMFVVGVYTVDTPDHPRVYAAFWAVIMGLVLWLCGLAIKDLRYTNRKIAEWRAQRAKLEVPRAGTDVPAEDSSP